VPWLAKGTPPGRLYPGDAYRRAWNYANRAEPLDTSGEAHAFVAGCRLVQGGHRVTLPASGRTWWAGEAWVELADARAGQGALVYNPVLQTFYDRAGAAPRSGVRRQRGG
jgi:hypothetical protein